MHPLMKLVYVKVRLALFDPVATDIFSGLYCTI